MKRPLDTPSSTAPMRTVLAAEDKTELEKIWALDKRMPSIQSRRAWAQSRELKAGAVHAWFYYMRHRHNKSGGGLAEGTYDLTISAYIPVVIPDTATSLERIRKRVKVEHATQSSEPPADYVLSDSSTAVGSTGPTTPRNFDGDQYLDWSDFTSSDTFLPSTPTPAPLTPLGKCAYSRLAEWNQKASGLSPFPFSPGFAYNRAGAYASRGAYKVLSARSSEKGLPSAFSQSSSLPPSSPISSPPSSPALGACKPGSWRDDLQRERQTQPVPPSPNLRLPLLPASCDCILCQPAMDEDLLVLEPYAGTTRIDFDAALGLSFRFEDSCNVLIEDSGSGVLWVGHGTALDSGILGPFDADRFMQDWLEQGPGEEELASMESAYRYAELDKGLSNLYAEQDEEETEYVNVKEEEEEN